MQKVMEPKANLVCQSIVCIIAILICQQLGFLSLEKFNVDNAKQCMWNGPLFKVKIPSMNSVA